MLAFRVAQELTTRYRERVTAILPSKRQGQGPDIDRLPGARVIERDELTSQAFTDAQITSARALALLRQDDVGNFHAALRARELNPDIRLVVAVFSPGLGEQVRAFFPDCAVLVGTSMSAPSFVAAALGEPAPSHVRVSGRTLFVARPEDADPAQVLCGLAAPSASGGPMLLPRNEQSRRSGAGRGRRHAAQPAAAQTGPGPGRGPDPAQPVLAQARLRLRRPVRGAGGRVLPAAGGHRLPLDHGPVPDHAGRGGSGADQPGRGRRGEGRAGPAHVRRPGVRAVRHGPDRRGPADRLDPGPRRPPPAAT